MSGRQQTSQLLLYEWVWRGLIACLRARWLAAIYELTERPLLPSGAPSPASQLIPETWLRLWARLPCCNLSSRQSAFVRCRLSSSRWPASPGGDASAGWD